MDVPLLLTAICSPFRSVFIQEETLSGSIPSTMMNDDNNRTKMDNDNNSQQQQQLISCTSQLPTLGLDILLIGPKAATDRFAAALLTVRYDRDRPAPLYDQTNIGMDDPAVTALRQHLAWPPAPQRRIHTLEGPMMGPNSEPTTIAFTNSLSSILTTVCIDHIVLLHTTGTTLPDNSHNNSSSVGESQLELVWTTCRSVLHSDWIRMERLTIVQDRKQRPRPKKDRPTGMPLVLWCSSIHDNASSSSSLARIVLERTRRGIRHIRTNQSCLSPISPILT